MNCICDVCGYKSCNGFVDECPNCQTQNAVTVERNNNDKGGTLENGYTNKRCF